MQRVKIIITIEVPEGAEIEVETATQPTRDPVSHYWHDYLSENARQLYGAAAKAERDVGPGYSLADLARRMGSGTTYERAQSIHRTSGRSAKRWRNETGTEPPIRLEATAYDWREDQGGMRTAYKLPPGVAEAIQTLQSAEP